MIFLNFDNVTDFDVCPFAMISGVLAVVDLLSPTIVKLVVRFVALVIFVSFLEHGEDEYHREGTDHRGRSFGTEGQGRQDSDDQKVDICCTLELVKQRQRDPREYRILCCTDLVT